MSRRRYVVGSLGSLTAALSGCLGQSSDVGDSPEGTNVESPLEPITLVESLPTPVRGDADADVTVAVYEDYACPHCQTYTLSVLPELADEFMKPGKIRYEHHDFPIPVDQQWSWTAPNAARAVYHIGGPGSFWRYSRKLYENQGNYSLDRLRDLATQVGANGDEIRQAARLEQYRPVIEADRREGEQRGVKGTPTVFVNDRSVRPTLGEVRRAINDELG